LFLEAESGSALKSKFRSFEAKNAQNGAVEGRVRSKVDGWRLKIEAWRLKMEAWSVFWSVVADSHHLDEEQDSDPDPY